MGWPASQAGLPPGLSLLSCECGRALSSPPEEACCCCCRRAWRAGAHDGSRDSSNGLLDLGRPSRRHAPAASHALTDSPTRPNHCSPTRAPSSAMPPPLTRLLQVPGIEAKVLLPSASSAGGSTTGVSRRPRTLAIVGHPWSRLGGSWSDPYALPSLLCCRLRRR